MTPAIAALLMQTAGQVVGQGMGLGVGEINNRRNLTQQRKLQNMQIAGQKDLTSYNQAQALQMWKDTNYSAQMEELRKAGLNPGLIYGMTGGGGTTSQVTQGNVTGGHVPAPMGIEGGINGAQLALLKSQKELIDAQANKEKATTPATGQTEAKIGAETESILQGVNNAKAEQKLTELKTAIGNVQLDFDKGTLENRKSTINLILSKLIEETKIMENERLVSDRTIQTKVGLLRQELALKVLEGYKTSQETKLIKEHTRAAAVNISNAIQENMQNWDKMTQEQQRISLDRIRTMGGWNDVNVEGIMDNILIIPKLGGKK